MSASNVRNTKSFRRALRRSAPEVSISDAHTRGCEVLSSREALLGRLPSGGTAAEIGVANGEYTLAILAHNRPRVLHLVDLWESDRYRKGLQSIRRRFESQIADGGIQIHQGMSIDVLHSFPEAYFDWVYIDTDHSYETTLAELRAAAPKMRPGGIIAGHDFCPGNVLTPWPYGVVEACNMFCVEAGWRYRFLAMEARGRLSFALHRE
jgi:predicted O-methyltransferase YrrM